MNLGLCGKDAIGTGSSRGIGRAISEAFIVEGIHTVIADIDPDFAKPTDGNLTSEGAGCIGKHVDVANAVMFPVFGPAPFITGKLTGINGGTTMD